ncbi:universal stress protein [Burkholderia gladioli]|uniref:universal stress protein n=1 Tax=Burkholderia gladioli TaxID=28095 RepID=UPI00163F88BC|nr:universal stress protein [Burkholderia gladioli]
MYQRIFAALDDSDGARRALDRAIDLARISGGTIDARYVVPDAPRLLDFDSGYADELESSGRVSERAARVVADAEAALRRAGVRGTAQAIEAGGEDVSAVLVRAAIECNADLIVMGTHGRRGMRRFWLGSVAESLLRSARRPVLVVREARDL